MGIDEAQDIIIMFYLQDISVQFLEEEHDNPIAALNKLVTYFETKLSSNGKKYDRSAIKFYLVNEMIKCRVFPNKSRDKIENEEQRKLIQMDIDEHQIAVFTKEKKFLGRNYHFLKK